MLPRLGVVLHATEEERGFEMLIRSLQGLRYTYRVYGMGAKWKNKTDKLATLRTAATEMKNCDVLMMIDAYDTMVLARPHEVMRKFLQAQHSLIVAAEKVCWPDAAMQSKYPRGIESP